ncbi:subtilase-type serine protease [Pseudomonas sp. BS3782 TE3695]|uniref:autotransporter outer membrane beta-barrel domain-containing protein n=1 Tax=Pseudomonas sp. BS3782 TE3695 TaxID=3349323 RepID=UPI003D2440A1
MPVQYKFRPQHLALAVALAVGYTNAALAQTATEPDLLVTQAPAELMGILDAFISDPATIRINVIKETKAKKNGVAVQGKNANELIILLPGGSISGIVDGGGGKNVLQLDSADGGQIGESRKLMGLEVKQGAWTLAGAGAGAGAGDFSVGALVRPDATLTNDDRIHGGALAHGTLINQGGIGTGVIVFSGGVLKNSGIIEGDVVVLQEGIFSGKGTVGALNVQGHLFVTQGAPTIRRNMELSKTAVLAYEVNPDGHGETIKVTGTASLGGATLKIVAAPGDYPATSKYRVIEAGKVQGEFGEVLNDRTFMTPTLHYEDGKNVDLTYARNDVPIEKLAITENGRKLAQSIEEPTHFPQAQAPSVTAAQPSTQLNVAVTALLGSSKATATYAIEQLAGGSNANLANATLSSVNPVGGSMLSAMRQLDSSDLDEQNGAPRLATGDATGRVWLQALGHGGTLDRSHGSSALQHSTKGLVLGADWALDEQWRIGVIGGQSQTRLDGSQLDGDLDSWHLGVYALRQSGPLALRLGATYGNHDGSTKRRVAFNGFSDRPKGSYDASTQQAFTEVGYNLGSGNFSAEPFANLGYQRYQRDSYTEKGGAAALQVHGQTQDNFSSTFGLRLAQLNTLDNGMQLTPRFSAGWKHTYGDVDSKAQQRLVTGGKNYTVEGAALDRDSLTLDAGLELAVSTRHTLGVGYNGELGNDSRSHGVMGQWRMAF